MKPTPPSPIVRPRMLALCGSLALVACSHAPPVPAPVLTEAGSAVYLVESAPIETTLDNPDVADAHEVWLAMVNAARYTLDFAQFYTSDTGSSRLTPVIAAIKAAAARKVRVRFLIDASYSTQYPETVKELSSTPGIEVRKLRVKERMGGVQHAKYLIVDRLESYLGSQNFDWRSLEHIQEVGVRMHSRHLTGGLLDVFETDWELAGGAADDFRRLRHPATGPVKLGSGETARFVASPKGWLPEEQEWDLPFLPQMLDAARREVGVQLLTYKTRSYDGSSFTLLDDALRRAVARGVRVRLLVSDWSNKPGSEARRSISNLSRAGVEVKAITIPPWSGGEIPFARVCHSKFLVVDGAQSWVGTSNWEGDYFLKSRYVGLVLEGEAFTKRLTAMLDKAWGSPYSQPLEPDDPNEIIKGFKKWKKPSDEDEQD